METKELCLEQKMTCEKMFRQIKKEKSGIIKLEKSEYYWACLNCAEAENFDVSTYKNQLINYYKEK
jgi:hypothetical protein